MIDAIVLFLRIESPVKLKLMYSYRCEAQAIILLLFTRQFQHNLPLFGSNWLNR